MQHFEIKGQVREVGGKATIKALRKQGLVPCNLYGCGIDSNILFTVDAKELKGLTDTPASYIVDLSLDNGKKYEAVLHEMQWHPVSDACLHVDFLAVDDKKPISIKVPIEITGHAIGVQQGGKFFQPSRELRISALMANLPDKVTVDITSLGLEKKIKAGDIQIKDVVILSDKDTIICGVKTTRNVTADAAAAA
jgi:large subunit ribosomal protein L25